MAQGNMSKIKTAAVHGLDVEIVTVETDLTVGLPNFSLVGLPGSAVRESKERVHAAVVNSGYEFPMRRITVNLSPADTRKEGSHFDLPIAVGVLAAAARGKGDTDELEHAAFLGELSLDGAVRKTELAAAMVLGLQEAGITKIVLPAENIDDVKELPGMFFFPITRLSDAVSFALGEESVPCVRGGAYRDKGNGKTRGDAVSGVDDTADALAEDFADVRGQEAAKRAVLIAVAGRHDIAITGPPGVGKSMLARRIPGILPPLTERESREVTRIHNIAGAMGEKRGLITQRPYRAPHHSATQTSIIGGGAGHRLVPGEVSLAHRGVLFLDELPEFERRTLDMLRQPLEDRYIDLSRVGAKGRYPCDFLLVCAMNPCPCGYYGDATRLCTCTEHARRRYQTKISGPLLDRIDIHISIGAVKEDEIDNASGASLGTIEMRASVQKAEAVQRARLKEENFAYNGRLSSETALEVCNMSAGAEILLKKAYERFGFSMRARFKALKVARTIADIEDSEKIEEQHIAEALAYRQIERRQESGRF